MWRKVEEKSTKSEKEEEEDVKGRFLLVRAFTFKNIQTVMLYLIS